MTHSDTETAYEMVESRRLETRNEIEKAQAAALNSDKLEQQLESAPKTLNQAPSAGAMPLPAAVTN
ncbi:MAG: hypothetical protein ACSHYF_08385 [Verrucomicrobiaceae bacterium]